MITNGWHLDKRVSVGHIVTTFVVAITAIVWMFRVENNVALNSQAIQALEKRIERSDQRYAEMFREIRNALVRIEQKIDRKADR